MSFDESCALCAHDKHNRDSINNNTFFESIDRVDEDKNYNGPQGINIPRISSRCHEGIIPYVPSEIWAHVPLEREKLLGLAQQAINRKKTKAVVFVSGDQHWGELSVKTMPNSHKWGPSQTLYEVTASGVPVPKGHGHDLFTIITQLDNVENFLNANRLKRRKAQYNGLGPFIYECKLPFSFNGRVYNDCVKGNRPWQKPWCYIDARGYKDVIGTCEEDNQTQELFSNSTKTCHGSNFMVCRAVANYGYIDVDWEGRTLEMGIRTPAENEQMYNKIKF